MSKAHFANFAENLTDAELHNLTGVGASLREFGKVLEDEWRGRNGVLLDKDQRTQNEGKPNAIGNPVINIEIPDILSIILKPSSDGGGKTRGNGYANDVGLSDKIKTGNVPPTLLLEILVDKIATMLDGNIAAKALNEIKDALQDCMTINDGKFSFDKSKAPPLNHPVQVVEWLTSLKQEFIGTTAGSTHVSMQVIPVPIDSTTIEPTRNDQSLGVPSPLQEVKTASTTTMTTVDKSPSDTGEGKQITLKDW